VLVDWFTVIAQIVNFLILVALLKYFLYGRIVQAMDKREETIRSRLEEAKNKRKEAEDEADSHRRKNEELEERREQMLGEAREEADRKLKELTREARKEVEGARGRWQESLEKEKTAFLQDLKQLAAREVYVLTRKALKDLADADLEERLVDVFVSKLKAMKKEDKDAVKKAIQEGDNKALVRSGFELSTGSRQKITRAVRDEIAEQADIAYGTEPQVIMGLELKARGEKVVWTIRDYLAELEERAKRAVEKEIQKGEEGEKSEEEEPVERERGLEVGAASEKEREAQQQEQEEQKPEKEQAQEEEREGAEAESKSDTGKKMRRKKRKKR
jgi:F-type H+-transporting ATPase subunit b